MTEDVDMWRAIDCGPKPQPTSADKNDNAIFQSSNTTSKERAVSLAQRQQGHFAEMTLELDYKNDWRLQVDKDK